MTGVARLLAESATRLLQRHCPPEAVAAAEAGGWSPGLWERLERADLARVGVPEAAGGAGGGLLEAAAVVRATARFAAPVPLAETCLIGGWLLAEAGLPLPDGPLSAAVVASDGTAVVPYGRCAAGVALLRQEDDGPAEVVLLRPGEFTVEPGANLAGEPRDLVRPGGAGKRRPAPPGLDAAAFRARCALARAAQMAGALERLVELSVEHAEARAQFGSPLARFQAVQQLLAGIAQEAAVAAAAVESALDEPSLYRVAAAKAAASEAAGQAAQMAHQVHGAIGFTHEHPLHLYTRRLWSWRDEHGSEAYWAAVLGELAIDAGASALWPLIAAEGGHTTPRGPEGRSPEG